MTCRFCEQTMSPTHNRCPACGRSVDAPMGDYTSYFTKKDRDRHHITAAFSYFAFFVLIPLIFSRRSHYARFHANQGLVLTLVFLSYTLVTRLFVSFLDMLFGGVYATIPNTLSSIFNFGSLFFFVLLIFGISNAVKGRAKELPLIGRIRFIV